MSQREPASVDQHPGAGWGGLSSMLFWLVLLVAAALYASVSLAPKILIWQRWQDFYVDQRFQLVEREDQLAALERMVAALEDDPQFVTELARLEIDAPSADAESLRMNAELSHDPRELPTSTSIPRAIETTTSWQPWLQVLATQASLRNGLLTAAAILVITAFTFLHDGSETLRARQDNLPDSKLSLREFWQKRYQNNRPETPESY